MDTTVDLLERFGGRKFLFTLVTVVLAFVLVLTGKASVDMFLDFLKFVGSAYFVANVGVKVTDVFRGDSK